MKSLPIILIVLLTSCGTLRSIVNGPQPSEDGSRSPGTLYLWADHWDYPGPSPYSGIRHNIEAVKSDTTQGYVLIIDWPFSIALDTALLPITFSYWLLVEESVDGEEESDS